LDILTGVLRMSRTLGKSEGITMNFNVFMAWVGVVLAVIAVIAAIARLAEER
jgi:hypothetical protein